MSAYDHKPKVDRLCPECGDKLHERAVACACGWRQAPRRRTAPTTPDHDQSCCWNDHGHTCGQPGVCSPSTTGGGSWYCRKHWALLRGWPEKMGADTMTYRQRWYAERGLPFEKAKIFNQAPFRCVGITEPVQRPAKQIERQPGDDSDNDVYGEAA